MKPRIFNDFWAGLGRHPHSSGIAPWPFRKHMLLISIIYVKYKVLYARLWPLASVITWAVVTGINRSLKKLRLRDIIVGWLFSNSANTLSILRVLSAIYALQVYCYDGTLSVYVFFLFTFGSFTDFLDGKAARRFGSSKNGWLIDRLADRVFDISLIAVLSHCGALSPLVYIAFLVRVLVVYSLCWRLVGNRLFKISSLLSGIGTQVISLGEPCFFTFLKKLLL